jgi:hypothetical protein
VIDSFERALDTPETLLPAYELLNRIRLCASDAVLAEAEQVLQRITEQYSLAQPFCRRNPHDRSVAGTEPLKRSARRARPTQIDLRRGVGIQPRQVI